MANRPCRRNPLQSTTPHYPHVPYAYSNLSKSVVRKLSMGSRLPQNSGTLVEVGSRRPPNARLAAGGEIGGNIGVMECGALGSATLIGL